YSQRMRLIDRYNVLRSQGIQNDTSLLLRKQYQIAAIEALEANLLPQCIEAADEAATRFETALSNKRDRRESTVFERACLGPVLVTRSTALLRLLRYKEAYESADEAHSVYDHRRHVANAVALKLLAALRMGNFQSIVRALEDFCSTGLLSVPSGSSYSAVE